MHLFHKKSGPLRPLPAGIEIDGNNYQEIRDAILEVTPIIDEQQTHINRGTNTFAALHERQRQIHSLLHFSISQDPILSDQPWLQEFNDVRCAMELKDITLKRLKKLAPEQITEEYESKHWETYLENYTYLLYLLNRLLKELADYEFGTRYWIDKGYPILEPPFPAGVSNLEKKESEEASGKKLKQVKFEKRVQGWYYNDDDIPLITGRGDDKRSRKEAEFHDKLVDGKSSTKEMILKSYTKRGGYIRCTEGFAKPVLRRQPEEYRLSPCLKPWRLD